MLLTLFYVDCSRVVMERKQFHLLTNPDTTKDAKAFAAVMDTLKATISPEPME